jgi:site-specific DNA recombinase
MATLSNRPASPYSTPIRVAWWGRVSTDDQQDPTLSLPRQLRSCQEALSSDMRIVAHFYDIESGRKDLELRGRGSAHEKFNIPIARDGGIQDLLEEARRPDKRFDAVICEQIERAARRTYYSTKIEHDLEQVGVSLLASDEPIGGRHSTTILTRRVKQGVAEWYVLDMLEKSWDGFCEHTRQGWNVGTPPYGYKADRIPHPVPAKRAEGLTKTRLIKDTVRALVVEEIFHLRVVERLSYADIRDRLNADLERHPPPVSPDPNRVKDYWSRSSIRDLIMNPKYTGYMVWNRKATKKGGKLNPPDQWVWSAHPTHEAIISKQQWNSAQKMTRRGSRSAPGQSRHPHAATTYLLRSFVFCDLCGNRMQGKTKKSDKYFMCYPSTNHGPRAAERFPNHPKSVHVREDVLIRSVLNFFAERLFGPDRKERLVTEIRQADESGSREKDQRARKLRRIVDEMDQKIVRQIRNLEREDDEEGILFRRVQDRIRELEDERSHRLAELKALDQEVMDAPNLGLIDVLPKTAPDFEEFSEESLRNLFEVFRLSVRFNRLTSKAVARITIDADAVGRILEFASSVSALRGIRSARDRDRATVGHAGALPPGAPKHCDNPG